MDGDSFLTENRFTLHVCAKLEEMPFYSFSIREL